MTAMVAAILVTALLAWGGWLVLRPAAERQVIVVPVEPGRPVIFGSVKLEPVDLPVALLFDCYENALENVPPRTDTSKRQWSWEAPPLPMDVARAELTKAGATENDRKILAWLEDWEQRWKQDSPTRTDQLWELEPLFQSAEFSADSTTLIQVGIALSFLDSDQSAVPWLRTGIKRAGKGKAEFQQGRSGAALCSLLCQTRALWQLRDFDSLRVRFAIERQLFNPRTIQARKSTHLLAVMNYYLGENAEALRLITEVADANKSAGDLNRSDQIEENWNHALFLSRCGNHEQVIPLLNSVLGDARFIHRAQVYQVLIEALAKTGQISSAETKLKEWQLVYKPATDEVIRLVSLIERVKAVN